MKIRGLIMIAALAFLPAAAMAADYTLTLSSDEVLAIAKALREQPYKDVASILQKMQQQLNAEDAARMKQAEPAPAADPSPTDK